MHGRLTTLTTFGVVALLTLVPQAGRAQTEEEATSFSAAAHRFEVGLFAGAHFFAADHGLGRYANDPHDLSPQHGFAFGGRVTWNMIPRLSVEAELLATPTETRGGASAMWVFGCRVNLLFNLLTEGSFRPFVLVGGGALSSFVRHESVVGNDTDPFVHAGLGAKFAMSETWGLRLDARVLVPPAIASDIASMGDETKFGGPDFELLAGVYFALGSPPKPAPPPPPLPPPPPPVDKDTDGDGILDSVDKCPLDPEDKDGFQDEDGCPDLDNDGDGILDKDDKCPNEPEDKDGFEDEDGCPDLDNDGDGILDKDDKCPNEPETKNGYQDEDGCPDEVPAAVKKFVGPVQGINFATNQATILKSSFKVLDKAVKVMTDFPEVRFEISGHTDNRGTAEHNRDLSQRRAQAVVDYLIKKGIAADRLQSAGYGFDRPLAENTTAAGRAKNRRTEFQLISEPAKAEPAKAEPAKAEPAPSEPTKAEPAKSDAAQ
jgi:outer membrane protein OmpA-like peptidoglycan-associated protein